MYIRLEPEFSAARRIEQIMVKIKLSVSTSEGKTQNIEVEGDRAQIFLGKQVGEELDGTVLGFQGSSLEITGGSDKDGFPMRRDVHGGIRSMILLRKGVGFKAIRKGERRRKLIRGNTITEDIVQINLKTKKLDEKKSIV